MTTFYQESGQLVQHWYAAALQKQVKKNGRAIRVEIFDIPIALWRDDEGQCHALIDQCSHRLAPLSSGRVVKNCLVCPYHGWTYDEEGKCVHIPVEGPNQERILGKSVRSFPVIERYDLIWIWMGIGKPDKEPFQMPIRTGKGWHYYYMETDFENNVTELVENFMDVPHTVFVHEGWFREKKQMCINATVERGENNVLVTYRQPADSIGFTGKLVNPKGKPMEHTDEFIFPNNTEVIYAFGDVNRSFIISSTCTPVRNLCTKVYTLIAYNLGIMNPLAHLFMPWYTRKVINQDVWIMAEHAKNAGFSKDTTFRNTQADTMHLYIESLRNWGIEAIPDKKPAPRKKEIEFWI